MRCHLGIFSDAWLWTLSLTDSDAEASSWCFKTPEIQHISPLLLLEFYKIGFGVFNALKSEIYIWSILWYPIFNIHGFHLVLVALKYRTCGTFIDIVNTGLKRAYGIPLNGNIPSVFYVWLHSLFKHSTNQTDIGITFSTRDLLSVFM